MRNGLALEFLRLALRHAIIVLWPSDEPDWARLGYVTYLTCDDAIGRGCITNDRSRYLVTPACVSGGPAYSLVVQQFLTVEFLRRIVDADKEDRASFAVLGALREYRFRCWTDVDPGHVATCDLSEGEQHVGGGNLPERCGNEVGQPKPPSVDVWLT